MLVVYLMKTSYSANLAVGVNVGSGTSVAVGAGCRVSEDVVSIIDVTVDPGVTAVDASGGFFAPHEESKKITINAIKNFFIMLLCKESISTSVYITERPSV